MKVSIILVNYNASRLLQQCLQSVIKETESVSYEIIVVDNGSTDDSRKIVCTSFPQVKLVDAGENLGFSRGNNLGSKEAKGEYLLFLNTDTILIENGVKKLADHLDAHSTVGAAGPKLLFEDRSFQLSAGRLPNIFIEAIDKLRFGLLRNWRGLIASVFERMNRNTASVGWTTGACMMVRRKAFEQVGGFDEGMFMFFEDKDLCFQLHEAGWDVMFYPHASIIHLLAGSSSVQDRSTVNKIYRQSQLHYYRKHLSTFQQWCLGVYLRLTGNIE